MAAAAAAAASLLITTVVFVLVSSSSSTLQSQHTTTPTAAASAASAAASTFRILYIVTSSKEDRLMNVVLPVLRDGIDDILSHSHFKHVDVYLILGYTLNDDGLHHAQLRSRLPQGVGLQIWNSAMPLYYELSTNAGSNDNNPDRRVPYLSEMQRTLARQHRYVVKDKLPYYDFFVVLEDDMLVRAAHVEAHVRFRNSVQHRIQTMKGNQLKQQHDQKQEPQQRPGSTSSTSNGGGGGGPWWEDDLTMEQWQRLQLGWIRVEVMPQRDATTTKNTDERRDVMLDGGGAKAPTTTTATTTSHLSFDRGTVHVDPAVAFACCRHTNLLGETPLSPPKPTTADQLVVWETGIAGLSLRKLPPITEILPSTSFFGMRGAKSMSSSSTISSSPSSMLSTIGWVALLGPPSTLIDAATVSKQTTTSTLLQTRQSTKKIGGYWSGSHDALSPDFHTPPSSRANHFFANPAGWMATQGEVFLWHTTLCKDNTFLPPLDHPTGGVLTHDGMGYATDYVEFWSGGMQLYGPTCQLQRIVSLDPQAYFSDHLMYHTANNKQHQLSPNRFVTASTLLEQLHAVRRAAEKYGREVDHDSR